MYAPFLCKTTLMVTLILLSLGCGGKDETNRNSNSTELESSASRGTSLKVDEAKTFNNFVSQALIDAYNAVGPTMTSQTVDVDLAGDCTFGGLITAAGTITQDSEGTYRGDLALTLDSACQIISAVVTQAGLTLTVAWDPPGFAFPAVDVAEQVIGSLSIFDVNGSELNKRGNCSMVMEYGDSNMLLDPEEQLFICGIDHFDL